MLERFKAGLSGPSTSDPGPASPSRMQGREPMLGYVAAVVIAIGGVLDILITTGKGSVAHPSTWEAYAGIVLALGVVASVQYRNRMLAPFVAIFGAFFVTLPKGPSVLSIPHVVVLITAVGFAVLTSMHQRRDQKILTPPMTSAQRRAAADARRRRRKGEPEAPPPVKRPPASRRYTPPKNAAKDKAGAKDKSSRR